MHAYRELMDYNVCGRIIREKRKLLIYGTCVRDEYPNIFEELSINRVPLAVCLEKTHMNMVALKIASLIARIKLDEIVVLTVDGSPHCVQLHFCLEEVAKIMDQKMPSLKHYVIEKSRAIEISRKAVKTARYLVKVQRLLDVND